MFRVWTGSAPTARGHPTRRTPRALYVSLPADDLPDVLTISNYHLIGHGLEVHPQFAVIQRDGLLVPYCNYQLMTYLPFLVTIISLVRVWKRTHSSRSSSATDTSRSRPPRFPPPPPPTVGSTALRMCDAAILH